MRETYSSGDKLVTVLVGRKVRVRHVEERKGKEETNQMCETNDGGWIERERERERREGEMNSFL